MPEQDYIALLALVRRRMTDEEIVSLRAELEERGIVPASPSQIGAGILKCTDQVPSDAEVLPVARHLRATGIEIDDADLPGLDEPADGKR